MDGALSIELMIALHIEPLSHTAWSLFFLFMENVNSLHLPKK